MQRFESFFVSRVCEPQKAQNTQKAQREEVRKGENPPRVRRPFAAWFRFFVFLVPFCGYLACFAADVKADDGYRLWLRYDQIPTRIKSFEVEGKSATLDVIRGELSQIVDPR